MQSFVFIDSNNEKYTISFGWVCELLEEKNSILITLYPNRFTNNSLAMCSFPFGSSFHIDESPEAQAAGGPDWWAKEFLSLEVINYINKLIKNKAFL